MTYDGKCARVLESIKEQNRPEDDHQDIEGDEQALYRCGRHRISGHSPHRRGNDRSQYISDRHCSTCGHPKADDQNAGDKNGSCGEGRKKS